MSEKKEYSASEVAQLLLEKLKKNIDNNQEIYNILEKSKNSSHEIDAGDEPNDDNAECPASLGGSGASEKSESSESPSMEDEPLQGDSDSDGDDDDDDDDDDDEESESEAEDYEFKKSEDGMFSVEYKRLAKNNGAPPLLGGSGAQQAKGFGAAIGAPPAPPAPISKDEDAGDKTNPNISTKRFEDGQEKMSDDAQAESARTSSHPQFTNKANQDYHKHLGNWRRNKGKKDSSYHTKESDDLHDEFVNDSKYHEEKKTGITSKTKKPGPQTKGQPGKTKKSEDLSKCGLKKEELNASDNKVKETKTDAPDEERTSDKGKEEKKGIKRPLEKCGDMIEAKKSEKLSSFLRKKEKMTDLKKKAPNANSLYNQTSYGAGQGMETSNKPASSSSPKGESFGQNLYENTLGSRGLGGVLANRSGVARNNMAQNMGQGSPTTAAKPASGGQGDYVLQNAPKGSQRAAQEKFNAGVDKDLGLNNQAKAPAEQAKAPAEQKYGMKNPFQTDDNMSFGQAFKAARKEAGAGGVFNWRGKKYNTHTRDEMQSGKTAKDDKLGAGREISKDNKFRQDWQKRKDFTGSQDGPASERAYYSNKEKAAPTQRPSARASMLNRLKAAKAKKAQDRQYAVNRKTGSGPFGPTE